MEQRVKTITKFKQTKIGMIPKDWEILGVGGLVTHRKGYAFKSKWFRENGKRIIKVSDFTADSIDISNSLFIDKSKADELKNFQIYDGDIIIATVGSWPNNPASIVGKVIRVPKKADRSLMNQNAVILRTDDDKKLNQNFLYYRLKNNDFSHYVVSGAQGSANQASITLRDIFSFEFGLPQIKDQEKIADILFKIDKKIVLNNLMNETFAELGRALFKRWFVDFEFPNENELPYLSSGGEIIDSELGSIPKGWEIGFLGDKKLTKILGSGINKFSGEKIYLATADVEENNIINYDTKITFASKPSRANMQPKIDTVWFAKMKDSKKILLFDEYHSYELNNLILSTGFVGLEVKSEALYYIWNIINDDLFEKEKDNYCIGTTMQAINNDLIKLLKVLIPDTRTLKRFNDLIKVVYHKINNNHLENKNLVTIRDSLLPRLMSGKIRVPTEVGI